MNDLIQLTKISLRMVQQYIGLFLFLVTSLIISHFEEKVNLVKDTLVFDLLLLGISSLILIISTYPSTSIRQKTRRHE